MNDLFIDRRRALPVAHVDDDALGTAILIFVVCRAKIDRAGFFSARCFQQLKLFLIVVGGKADVVDAGLDRPYPRRAAAR